MALDTEEFSNEEILKNADLIRQSIEEDKEREKTNQQQTEQKRQQDQQELAEVEDSRNQEDWGPWQVGAELSSAVKGGVQDTASTLITAPERVIDFFTGEMGRESKTEEGYKPESDDWFVDDENPIETKTWWGGLIRGLTHYGTLAAVPIPGTKVVAGKLATTKLGKAAIDVGAKYGPKTLAKFGTKKLTLGNVATGSARGAKVDALSIYSQDANALQIINDHLKEKGNGWLDTPLTTKDTDHPLMKTVKNLIEGCLVIGPISDLVLFSMGASLKSSRNVIGKKIKDRNASIKSQKKELVKEQLKDPGFRAPKNEPIADPWQGAVQSVEPAIEVDKTLRRTRKEWGAEEGSTGQLVRRLNIERAAQSAEESEKVIEGILKDLYSTNKLRELTASLKEQGTTVKQAHKEAIEMYQRIGAGREAVDQTPEEWLAPILKSRKQVSESLGGFVRVDPKYIHALDLFQGALVKDLRDTGILGREIADFADLHDVDGPAAALADKLVLVLTEAKKIRYAWGLEGRLLKGPVTPKMVKDVKAKLDADLIQTREAVIAALNVAKISDNDDLTKAIFEAISMSNDIRNIEDFDAFIRTKLRGGELNGKDTTGQLVKQLQAVMVNSVLSGPKTPVRAIMGTSTATFLRPMSMALGAALKGDGQTYRAALASTNAMMQAIPEAWKLFRTNLNSYWSGDIATIKTRFSKYSKFDEDWKLFQRWTEVRGDDVDKAVFRTANLARALNDSNFLTYSTKIMAATDDAFGYIIGRARAREKAMREAMENLNDGDFTNITPELLKDAEDRFLKGIFDNEGNLTDEAAKFAKKEATLTQDLSGFAKGLNDAFNITPWTKPFFLFARTGINGLTLTAKHTPLLNRAVRESRDILNAKPNKLDGLQKYGIESAEDLANAQALIQGRVAIGASLISMASMLYMTGGLHGNGPSDRSKRNSWTDAGWRPRQIRIGGVWVSYDAFEPFNQILATIGDIGDHMELMGEEWTEDQFMKLAVVVAQGVSSKSYLAGLQQFADFFGGEPGQQGRVLASLMNNQIPLSSLRNELSKIFTPYMRELNSGIYHSIRNRNLIFENIAGSKALPIKYDLTNGKPIKDHDFMTRMFNAFSPIQFNLDYSPGKQLLFESGYDLRTSVNSAPTTPSISLARHPRVRSMFQKAIGEQNIEAKLNKLAKDKKIQASIAKMNADRRNGKRYLEPKDNYYHVDVIAKIFSTAKKAAWGSISQEAEVKKLVSEERSKAAEAARNKNKSIDQVLIPTR
tara:strand:+ start:1446 stop:5216 length:3771 start_codon:yes stop_codon:yes gene_type:complete